MGISDWGKKKQPAYKPPKAPVFHNFPVGLGEIAIVYTNFDGDHTTLATIAPLTSEAGVVVRVIPTGSVSR
jgi:hypothetical protein